MVTIEIPITYNFMLLLWLKTKIFENKKLLLLISIGIKFLAIFAGLGVNRWLNQYVSPDGLRIYNLILVFTSIILGASTFGIPELVQKHYTHSNSKNGNKEFWTTLTVFRVFQYFISVALIFILYPFSRTEQPWLIVGIFTAQYILLFDSNFRSISDAFNKNWQFSSTDLVGKLLLLGGLYGYIRFFNGQNEFIIFIWISIFAYFCQFLLDWYINHDHIGISRFKLKILKDNYKNFLYLGVTTLIMGLYSSTDKWFIDYFGFSEFEIVGYSNAFKLIEISLVVPSLIGPTLATISKQKLQLHLDEIISNSKKVSEVDYKNQADWPLLLKFQRFLPQYYRPIFAYIVVCLLIGIITTAGILMIGYFGLKLIDPKELYLNYSWPSLKILAFALLPGGLNVYFSLMNIFLDGEKFEFLGIIIIAVVVLGLYLFLIPRYGHIGAALSSLIGNLVIALIKGIFMHISLKKFYLQKIKTSPKIENLRT